MGGYNSGRWHWHTPKTCVEDCTWIGVKSYSNDMLERGYLMGGVL